MIFLLLESSVLSAAQSGIRGRVRSESPSDIARQTFLESMKTIKTTRRTAKDAAEQARKMQEEQLDKKVRTLENDVNKLVEKLNLTGPEKLEMIKRHNLAQEELANSLRESRDRGLADYKQKMEALGNLRTAEEKATKLDKLYQDQRQLSAMRLENLRTIGSKLLNVIVDIVQQIETPQKRTAMTAYAKEIVDRINELAPDVELNNSALENEPRLSEFTEETSPEWSKTEPSSPRLEFAPLPIAPYSPHTPPSLPAARTPVRSASPLRRSLAALEEARESSPRAASTTGSEYSTRESTPSDIRRVGGLAEQLQKQRSLTAEIENKETSELQSTSAYASPQQSPTRSQP